ncbi:MAG: VOC family protein [Pseudomonadales bacterium]
MTDKQLIAYQACFVVNNVEAAVKFCSEQLGWGPFQHFKIPSQNAQYRDWQGDKLTEVALGMAGRAQVELIHVHSGQDAIQQYQSKMGAGFQHLGVLCQSTDDALAHLGQLGAVLNDRNQYGEITFSFVDVPQGPALIELLERGEQGLPGSQSTDEHGSTIGKTEQSQNARLLLDRATLVTADIESSAEFYAKSFKQRKYVITDETLRYSENSANAKTLDTVEVSARRCLIDAGVLAIELIQTLDEGQSVYGKQLKRAAQHGGHGLVHVGGCGGKELDLPESNRVDGQWLECGESFSLYSGPDELSSIQVRY